MNKLKFIKHINELEEEQLREELLSLFLKVEGVKQYYQMDLGTDKDRNRVFAKAKIEIEKKFVTKSKRRPRRPRIQKTHAILKNLNKVSVFGYEMIDPYLFTAETALQFASDYYFSSTPLLNIIKTSFEKACGIIKEEILQNQYKDRCEIIRRKSDQYYMIRDEISESFDNTFL